MKACSDLQERGYPSPDIDIPFGRSGDTGKELQQSGFAGAVGSDNADALPLLYFKINATKSPECLPDQSGICSDPDIGIVFSHLLRPPRLKLPLQCAAADRSELISFSDTAYFYRKSILFHSISSIANELSAAIQAFLPVLSRAFRCLMRRRQLAQPVASDRIHECPLNAVEQDHAEQEHRCGKQ